MSTIKYTPVSSIMNPNIKSVDGLSTVAEAITIMREGNYDSLIINKRDEHDEYGLISITDLSSKVVVPDVSPQRTNVYEIMTKPVLSVESDMNTRYAIRLLTRFNVSQALVLKDGEAVGMVSLRDMVLNFHD